MNRSTATMVLIAALAAASPVHASDIQHATELADLSLEQLMDIEVTSVSKREEPLLLAASAIYVITQEDIRRSGFTSIPELLRVVPGVQGARIDGNKWAITVRGFDAQFSNKLLVIMDGRTAYDSGAVVHPHATAPSTRRLHVPLAEDNSVNQLLAARLLEKAGHTVVVANNGREALAALEKEPFDLVLMDVQMPEMDGFEATAAIREHERATGAHVPIIAMTAHAMQGDEERCLQAGMNGYVSKPIDAKKFHGVISSVVNAAALPPQQGPPVGSFSAARHTQEG